MSLKRANHRAEHRNVGRSIRSPRLPVQVGRIPMRHQYHHEAKGGRSGAVSFCSVGWEVGMGNERACG